MLKRSIIYETTETASLFSRDSTGRRSATCGVVLPVIIIILLFIVAPANAQRKSDIGMMTGVPWYLGDISSAIPLPTLVPPAIGPIFRYNFNMRNALRAHAVLYELGGSGEILGGEEALFQASFVDLGLDFEFNWWPYKTAHRKTKYSPYVSAGIGYSINHSGGSVSHLYLPFGGGVKANLGMRLSGGIEVNMRKTFTDLIDGVINAGGPDVQTPLGNNDWYMFTGVFLTYKIFNYKEECPTFDKSIQYSTRTPRPIKTK